MASNTPAEVSAVDDVLECNICKTQIKQPYTLQQCLHSYCKTCLDTVTKEQKDGKTGWYCPLCKTFTEQDDVKKDDFIDDLLQFSTSNEATKDPQEVNCKQCLKEVKATKKCVDCKLELCDDCQEVHLRIPILKDHEMIDIEIQSEKVIDKLIYCKSHPSKIIEFNCETCNSMACIDCSVEDHRTHTLETVTMALEKMLPNIKSDTENMENNIKKIELQLVSVAKTIEETKETYSLCRMEMDDRLEKLINRFKAAKAKMEEDVNEQETIALDILQNIKQQLQNQLSQLKKITNLSNVTTAKARHTSLLNQFQSGLFDKVKEFGQHEQQAEPFQILIPEFLECKLEDLQKLIGEVQYDGTLSEIDTAGVIWRDRNFICDDLSKFMGKEMVKLQEINIDTWWCNRLSYINNKLWVGLADAKELKIYNCLGELIKTVKSNKRIIVVKKAKNGDIIVGGYGGLFVTNDDCSEWIKLTDGQYSDISIHGSKFTALRFDELKVVTFILNSNTDDISKQWTEVTGFDLPKEHFYEAKITDNTNNTLLANNDNGALISKKDIIYTFTEGSLTNSYKTKQSHIFLCGMDKTGKMLVGSFIQNKLYVTDNLSDFKGYNVRNIELNIQCNHIRDAVIDGDGNLWTLQGNNGHFKLIKYVTAK